MAHPLFPSAYFPLEAFGALYGILTPLTLTAQYNPFDGLAVVFLEQRWHVPRLKAGLTSEHFFAGLKSSSPC